MRVLVCGGRDFTNRPLLYSTLGNLHHQFGVDVVIEGDARGADRLAGYWARHHGIDDLKFRADWDAHGKAAGPIRNKKMLAEGRPDMVLAFAGGRGTAHMVKIAREAWDRDIRSVRIEG